MILTTGWTPSTGGGGGGGGLKTHITQMFTSIELALRSYLGQDQSSLTAMKDKIIDDEGIQSSRLVHHCC